MTRKNPFAPLVAIAAIVLSGGTWLIAGQNAGKPSIEPAAVLARRQASLKAIKDVLGNTRSGGNRRASSAPFFSGFLAAFQGLLIGTGISAVDATWEQWQQRTGELPPDFATMPSMAEIPDPLLMLGTRVPITTVAQWNQQKKLIRAEFEKWVFGKMPPRPTNLRAVVTGTRREGDVEVRDVRLEFGPDHRATLRLQLMIPSGPGPFPVFMTDHPNVRPWVNIGLRRGYVTCMYYAAEASYLGRDDSALWQDLFPDSDFSQLTRWSWGAMRAIDYLETLPMINRAQIAISGHSRNSKQALLAAAFDERIGAVAASRGNAADSMPFRYNTYPFMAEPMEELTDGLPYFLHPRLRFFVGNEHKLPVDINMLQSLVAPRGLLVSHAFTEHQGNAFAVEQSYRSAKTVYQFFKQPGHIGLYQQPGEHPAGAEDVEVYFDFFDTIFGRAKHPVPEMFVHGYTFDGWRKVSGTVVNPLTFPERRMGDFLTAPTGQPVTQAQWPTVRKGLIERIQWALGKEPPAAKFPNPSQPGSPSWWASEGYLGQVLPRRVQGLRASDLAFGDALKGEFYLPDGRVAGPASTMVLPEGTPRPPAPGEKWPVVIWLHPESYASGYSRYSFWSPLVENGFAVFAFDQVGFGTRSTQALNFYNRYPQWSLMGKMVADTRAAIDAVMALGTTDPNQVYIAGLGLGAQVGLITAALDERVKGVATITGLGTLRTMNVTETEGVKRYSHLHGLMPKLGFFLGRENRLPFDFDEVLAAIAPRPVMAVAPTMDRYYPLADVTRLAAAVEPVYRLLGRDKGIEVASPREFSRFPNPVQKPAYDWLSALAGRPAPATAEGGKR